MIRYLNSHAGKAVLCVALAAFLLAVPLALPWIAAVALLRQGIQYFAQAFKEADLEILDARVQSKGMPLPGQVDGERRIAGPGRDLVSHRS